jgi:hypothetical protein
MKAPSRPWWWKPLWAYCALSIVGMGFIMYFYSNVLFWDVLGGVSLTLVCVGVAYYVRVRPNIKVNRAIYILLGISPIGFLLMIALLVSGFVQFLRPYLGWGAFIITVTVPYIIGAFVGDWIGKKRSYRLSLTP